MVTTLLAAIPSQKLSAPGRAFLEELLTHAAGWNVAIEQIGSDWFLVDSCADGAGMFTPIEVFDLEDGALV